MVDSNGNAKIGKCDSDDDVMGKYGFGDRNERSEKLIQFARLQKLFITNSMFKKKTKTQKEEQHGL